MRFLLATLIISLVGCGTATSKNASMPATMMDESESTGWSNDSSVIPRVAESSQSEKSSGSDVKTSLPERKIIYTASMEVVVEVFDQVEKKIESLVQKHGGFVASANLGRMQGERRSGNWTVRVPVDQYDSFLNAIGNIGVPASRHQTASDVTEEFIDISARISNKKKLEARIVELLDRPDDKIQHVIEVERELGRVREDIERMEGRLRYLQDQTSLTTVTINVREERDYVPPQAPTLSSRVNYAWSTSLINCRRFFENAVIFVVANAIGFCAFLVGLVIAIPILKKLGRFVKNLSAGSADGETSTQS